MPSDVLARPVVFGLDMLGGFVLVLARVAGLFVFFPLPGLRFSPSVPRIVFALSLTIALAPFWPAVDPAQLSAGGMVAILVREAAMGLALGLCTSFLAESFALAAQLIAAQAGYSYATTIDPTSQADSGVLGVIAQLFSGLLFFALGVDRQIVAVLAASVSSATVVPLATAADWIVDLSRTIFSAGLRLALPVAALLVTVDVALALVSKVNQQLQLITVAFPAKMLLALVILASSLPAFVLVYRAEASRVFTVMERWHGAGVTGK